MTGFQPVIWSWYFYASDLDALSLTRACPERSRRRVEGERVRVWVCATLPDTRMHWRRRRILIRGDFAGPTCTLSPTLSRKLNGRGTTRQACPHPRSQLAFIDSPGWVPDGREQGRGTLARGAIFSAPGLKILMPGAKNRRQALRSHTPTLSHPGEGVNLLRASGCSKSVRGT